MTRKKLLIYLVVFLISPCLLLLDEPQSMAAPTPNDTLTIAALLHLTGEYAQAGRAFYEGALLAQHEINTSSQERKPKLEILFEDTQYDMKTVNTLAQKALHIDNVPLALISNYTEVMVAGPVFERANTPLITLWDSSPEIEKIGDHVFGIGVWAPSTSEVAVRFARDELSAQRAITVATNGQWSLAVANSFKDQFQDAGGTIIESFAVNPEETDFRSLVSRIKKLQPDVIYAPLSDHQVPFWKQLHTGGFQGIRITSDVLNEELLREIGPLANGIYQTQVADPHHVQAENMKASYRTFFKKECTQLFLTALGYDGVHLAYRALLASPNQSPQEITQALYATRDHLGAAGRTSITPQGSARKSSSIFLVQDGKLVNNSKKSEAHDKQGKPLNPPAL